MNRFILSITKAYRLLWGDGMGYKIQYKATRKRNPINIRLPLLILIFFLIFCMLVKAIWPDGSLLLKKMGVFPDSSVAVSALNDLAEQLQYGNGFASILKKMIRKVMP